LPLHTVWTVKWNMVKRGILRVWLPAGILEKIDEYAEEGRMTRSDWVRNVLD